MTGRRGPFDVDTDRTVEELRLAWGDAYDVGYADGAYHAKRLDGTGDLLTGETPDVLGAAIRADWNERRRP